MLSHCSLLKNPSPTTTRLLDHCLEGENKFWFSFFGPFPSDRTRKATKYVNDTFLYSQGQFLYTVPANSGNRLKLPRVHNSSKYF
jgi:hypothetical protein